MSASEKMNQIDQIRDIVFGREMEDYNQRFENLRKIFDKECGALEDSIEETRSMLHEQSGQVREELGQAVNRLSTELEEQEERFLKANLKTEKKMAVSLEKNVNLIEKKIFALQDAVGVLREQIDSDLVEMQSYILSEIDEKFSQLEATKVSRSEIASLFMRMGQEFTAEPSGDMPAMAIKPANDNIKAV